MRSKILPPPPPPPRVQRRSKCGAGRRCPAGARKESTSPALWQCQGPTQVVCRLHPIVPSCGEEGCRRAKVPGRAYTYTSGSAISTMRLRPKPHFKSLHCAETLQQSLRLHSCRDCATALPVLGESAPQRHGQGQPAPILHPATLKTSSAPRRPCYGYTAFIVRSLQRHQPLRSSYEIARSSWVVIALGKNSRHVVVVEITPLRFRGPPSKEPRSHRLQCPPAEPPRSESRESVRDVIDPERRDRAGGAAPAPGLQSRVNRVPGTQGSKRQAIPTPAVATR